MDEPFSALDVLTSENLRSELLDLWRRRAEGEFPTKAIVLVTHSIEEAVQMADRIFVLTSNPGRLRAEIPNPLERPRDRRSPEFLSLVDHLYTVMTGRDAAHEPPAAHAARIANASPVEVRLPPASIAGMAGLLEILDRLGGREDLPALADRLTFEVDDLLPLTDAVDLLGFASVRDADLLLTDSGRRWSTADIRTSKSIFAEAAGHRAPLVRAIVKALGTTKDGTLNERFFLDLLARGFSEDEGKAQRNTAIEWGRYGELFDYDAGTGELRLDPPPV
jgi:NitT/TauT family transport system ATP-binding protein